MKLTDANKKFKTMKDNANVWLATWKDLAKWIRPTRGKFEGDEVNDGSMLDYKQNLNDTSQMAVRTFASGMLSGMTSPARKWFKLEIQNSELNELEHIKIWLEKAEDLIRDIFSKSNVYGALSSIYEEISIFATAAAIVERDYHSIIRLRNFTAGEYFLANDNNGRVNTFSREFSMTISQLVAEFGFDNVSSSAQEKFNNDKTEEIVLVRHLICPNLTRDYTKKDNKNMAFWSLYWEVNHNEDKFLRRSGYNTFPILAPRWGLTATSDIYGKDSPGFECLGDVKMLQKLEENKLYAIDMGINPPRLMDDSIEVYDFLPGGLTRYNSTNPNNVGVRNLDVSAINLAEVENTIRIVETRIARTFYADLFLMLTSMEDQQRTATEVRARIEEKMLVLAPALEKINNEAISPLIDFAFSTILELGLLPPPPEELQGSELKIEYISTIAQAQKMVGTQTIEQLMAFTGNLMAVSPTIIDNVDLDEAVNEYGTKLGVSPRIIRGKAEIAQIRDARAKQQQQAQMQQEALATIQGAKVLSDTEIKDNTALSALLGGNQ